MNVRSASRGGACAPAAATISEPGTALALRVLSLAVFAMGLASLSVVSAVPAIAASLHIADGRAGLLVAAFALTFAVSAPLIQIVCAHYSRRTLLLAGLTLMAFGTLGCALAPDFPMLFVARMLTGLGAAAVSPVASSLGSTLVAPSRQGYALAVVFGGMTVASVVGVPLASWVVGQFGWRWMFGAISLLSVAAAAVLACVIQDRAPGQRLALSGVASALCSGGAATSLLAMVLAMASFYTGYTMIVPLLTQRYGATPHGVTFALVVAGVAGLAGNQLARRLALRRSAQSALYLAVGLMLLAAGLLAAGPPLFVLALGVMVAWSLAIDLLLPAQQRKMVELRPDMRGLMLSLNSSSLFVGTALGALLASQLSQSYGLGMLAPVCGVLAMAALVLLRLPHRPSPFWH